MNRKIVLLSITMFFLAAGCNNNYLSQTHTATIGSHKINIELATTEEQRDLGLGNRDFLPADSGMLFIFSTPDKYTFWMKDMRFPLDFIWIRSGKVVQITPNIPIEPNILDSALQRYSPQESVDQVLEVNAGWSDKNQIKVGDSVAVDQF